MLRTLAQVSVSFRSVSQQGFLQCPSRSDLPVNILIMMSIQYLFFNTWKLIWYLCYCYSHYLNQKVFSDVDYLLNMPWVLRRDATSNWILNDMNFVSSFWGILTKKQNNVCFSRKVWQNVKWQILFLYWQLPTYRGQRMTSLAGFRLIQRDLGTKL